MTFINWNQPFFVDPATLSPTTDNSGIPIPTYGNYGGPNLTAGVYNGVQVSGSTAVDSLDLLFAAHDLATGGDPGTQLVADVALIESVVALKPNQLDAEASLYAGATTLAYIAELAQAHELSLMPAHDLHHAVLDAFQNIVRGATHLDAGERVLASAYVDEVGAALEAALPTVHHLHFDLV